MKAGDLLMYNRGTETEAIGIALYETVQTWDGRDVTVMKVMWFDDWLETHEMYPIDTADDDDDYDDCIEIISPGSSVG